MKIKLLGMGISAALLAQASLACSPPPPVTPPPLPTGLDGRLPVTYPEKDPNYPYIPPVTNGTCPVQLERYANQAKLPSLTDAETDRVYGAANPVTPVWDAAKVYNTGDLASVDGVTYKAKWWTQNEKPGQPWGAWEEQAALSGPQPWSAGKAYQGGEQVTFNGRLYQARWWTQNNAPDQANSPWEDKGAAPQPKVRPPQVSSTVTQQTNGTLNVSVYADYSYPVTLIEFATADCNSNYRTEGTRPASATPPTIERWEVHIDGRVAASTPGPGYYPYPVPIPPAPRPLPRNPDGTCTIAADTVINRSTTNWGGIVSGSIAISAAQAAGNYVSVWLCNGDVCRPSTLLAKYKFGQIIW